MIIVNVYYSTIQSVSLWFLPLFVIQYFVMYNVAMVMQLISHLLYIFSLYRQATLQFVCDYALIHYDNLCLTVCHVHVDLIVVFCMVKAF